MLSDSIGLHRMENPSHTDGCVSMHLYSPPFASCRTFDERTGHEREVKVTFWSKYGERTPLAVVSYFALALALSLFLSLSIYLSIYLSLAQLLFGPILSIVR